MGDPLPLLELGLGLLGPAIGAGEGLGPFQQPAGTDGPVQARVTDLVEAWGEDVLDQPAKELHRMDGGGPAVLRAYP